MREQRREQKGHLYRRGKSWFVRYFDDVLQSDGTVKRKQVSQKLEVSYCDEYRTKKSVRPFAAEILAPINRGLVTVQSTMQIVDFVEKEHLPKIEEHRRASNKEAFKQKFSRAHEEFSQRRFQTGKAPGHPRWRQSHDGCFDTGRDARP